MPKKAALQADVDALGEIHAVVDGHDAELEIRKGQVTWDEPDADHFTLRVPGHPQRRFAYDDVFDWFEPDELFHEP